MAEIIRAPDVALHGGMGEGGQPGALLEGERPLRGLELGDDHPLATHQEEAGDDH